MGSTIKNEIKVESSFEVSHIRARTIKDATGTDFTVIINGHRRSSTIESLAAERASAVPSKRPSKNPDTIFKKLFDMAMKNPSSCHSDNSLAITEIGEGNRNSSLTIIAAICHTASAKITAKTRREVLFCHIIESVCGK